MAANTYSTEWVAPLEAELKLELEAMEAELYQQLSRMEAKASAVLVKMLSPFVYTPTHAEDIVRSLPVIQGFDLSRSGLIQGKIQAKASAVIRVWEQYAPYFLPA